MITLSHLRRINILDQDKITDYPDLITEVRNEVLLDLLEVLNSGSFKIDPSMYVQAYVAERGPTRELRIPRDITVKIIMKHLQSIRDLIKSDPK